jgi:hypothetical protein
MTSGSLLPYQVVVLWSVLLEQRVGGEVGSVTTRGENDGSVLFVLLTVLFVFNTNHLLAILQNLRDLGLLEDLDTIRRALGEIFELPGLAGPNGGKRSQLTFSMRA